MLFKWFMYSFHKTLKSSLKNNTNDFFGFVTLWRPRGRYSLDQHSTNSLISRRPKQLARSSSFFRAIFAMCEFISLPQTTHELCGKHFPHMSRERIFLFLYGWRTLPSRCTVETCTPQLLWRMARNAFCESSPLALDYLWGVSCTTHCSALLLA